MFDDIEDIIILTKSGITLFQKMRNGQIENQLIGMMMSALNNFAIHLSKGEGISGFEISKLRFTIINKNNLLFVASSSKNSKEKKILKELEYLSKKFFEFYPKEILNNLLIDVDNFSDFEDKINHITEDNFKNQF